MFTFEKGKNVKQLKMTHKIIGIFELNRSDPSVREHKYTEIPLHYVWEDSRKKWKKRSHGGDITMYTDVCSVINTDIFNQIPGEQRTYHNYDKIICDNDDAAITIR